MAINFYNEEISFVLKQKKIYKERIKNIVEHYKFNVGDINFIFTSEKKILEINKQYLNHNYYTDIITFPFSNSVFLSADIFISIPTVKSNSNNFNTSFICELNRVMIHGVLHLVGFDDTDEEKQKRMREEENYWLKIFGIN